MPGADERWRRRAQRVVAAVLLMLGVGRASAQEAEEDPSVKYTGKIVALRTLVAPRGGLPSESLEPLLRVQQDSRYNPQAVRQDVAMLHRVLDFAQVEVDVEDWVAFGPDGEPIPAVRVEYRVYPPPKLADFEIDGNRVFTRRQLAAAAGLVVGDPFFSDDLDRVRTAARKAYAERGYPEAVVTVETATDPEGRVHLTMRVDEGEADRLREIRIGGDPSLSELEIRVVLTRLGLIAGRTWTEAKVSAAREELTRLLRRRGWYEGRVTLQVDPGEGRPRLVVLLDPRRRWEIDIDGKGLPGRRKIEEQLGLLAGARPSRRFAEEAGRSLTQALVDDGHLEADVNVTLAEEDERVALAVTGRAGPRHRLGKAEWTGTTVYSSRYLTDALREASPEIIARGRISPEAVDAALEVVQEFYRSQGYLSARLKRLSFKERMSREESGARVVPVDIRVAVESGPRALLEDIRTEAEVPGVDVEELFGDLRGKPLNPAEVELRCRKMVEALGEEGYLGADARPVTQVSEDGTRAEVEIRVTTGPVVYLRSVLVRGYRRTRRSVIEREIDVVAGDPLAPSRLAAIRRRLYELDLFQRVSVDLVGDEDRVKDLIVEVEERPNIHFEVGGGIATDQGMKLFLRGGHRNLFGLGHRVTLIGEGGVGWVGDGWTPDFLAPEWKAAARYEAPNLPGRNERVLVDVVFNEEEQQPTYRMQRSGGGFGVALQLGSKASAELGYHVQFRRLLDLDPGVIVAGDPWLDELEISDLANPSPVLPTPARAQSGLDVSFVLDLRDDPFNPTRGVIGNVLLKVTDELFSDLAFIQGEGSWSWWVPVAGFGLQGRVRAGGAWAPGGAGTIPLEDRFRLGGGASLRGFAIDSVGPVNEVSREEIPFNDALRPIIDYAGQDEPTRWVPTGGDAMGLMSLEFRIPLERIGLKRWAGTQLAVFTDVGNVWLIDPSLADSGETDPFLRWSVGLGVRRATVIGPIQVDLGFNPAKLRDETIPQLHISLGAL